jgi:hypothetical protein
MAGSRGHGSLGSEANSPSVDTGTLALTRSPSPGSICVVPIAERRDRWQWTTWKFIKWKVLPKKLGDDRTYLRKFKDGWVYAHRQQIVRIANSHGIPPLLLAGVAFIEVGGDPDWVDGAQYSVLTFLDSLHPSIAATLKQPEATSFGDVQIQLRRAAEAVGFEWSTMSAAQRDELLSCLGDEVGNLDIVAKHLVQLKNIDFPRRGTIGDDEIRIIGARYNRGPHLSLEQIRKNTSYGDFILRFKAHLLTLLQQGATKKQ